MLLNPRFCNKKTTDMVARPWLVGTAHAQGNSQRIVNCIVYCTGRLESSQAIELKSLNMEMQILSEKLALLRSRLHVLETVEMEKIRQKRILADMDDDFRENEGAKMVMEDHEHLHMRISNLKREILEVKKRLFKLKLG